jgi:hypothetical protein
LPDFPTISSFPGVTMRTLLLILFALFSLPALASYTKIANNGAVLPASAALGSAAGEWACTRDNATGLIWEVKTASGLRSQNNTYSNYDSNYGTSTQISAETNSQGFVAAVNSASLCGYGEWRMPAKEELLSLAIPTINASYFPNTPAALFWTATPVTGDASSAWDIDFSNGGVFTDTRSLASRVRLVRSLPASSLALTVSGSGSGTGSVISGGIACISSAGTTSGTCTAQRGSGSRVTLTATPTPSVNSTFAGWGGACSGTATTCTLTMDAAKSVSAKFVIAYSKVANNGAELPDSALLGSGAGDWACTRDSGSGLIWEVKTTDGGLRDQNKYYTNYDSHYGTQAQIDAASNSIGFANAVNSSGLCGYGEWRVPSKDELVSLVNTTYSPTINPTFFPNTPSSYFWSGSPDASLSGNAWLVYFNGGMYGGGVSNGNRGSGSSVRLVRGGQSLGTFALSVSTTGAGSGSINTGGIACTRAGGATSGMCSAERDAASSVTLSATPAPGSVFSGWSGACSGAAATCTFSMDAAKSVSAHFDVGPVVNGVCGSVNGQTLSAAPSTHLCSAGSASRVIGSAHRTWNWSCSAYNGGLPAACTATSSVDLYALNVSRAGLGRIVSLPAGIDCGSDCSNAFSPDSNVTLTATPAAGSHWAGWGGACSTTTSGMASQTCTLPMTAAKAVTATFTTYSKVANSGADLPASAPLGSGAGDWACTRANSSGLLWEVKTDDGGLRDWGKTYTNYDSNYGTSEQINAATNSIGLVNAVNSSGLCGVQGWRMPSIDELSGLVDKSFRPTLDPSWFPNTPSSYFWSGSPIANYSNGAWGVGFGSGFVGNGYRNVGLQVRLVRGGQSFGSFGLSLSSSGTGSGTLSADAGNIACSSSAGTTSGACSDNLPSGVLVTLTATPAAGSHFSGWGGACSGRNSSCTLKMDATKNVSAVFKTGPVPLPPGTPTNITIVAGSGSAKVSFTAPINDGGATISYYTATCTASGQTPRSASGGASPLTVRNLTGNVQYQCTLSATNEAGTGGASAPTAVTPQPAKKNSLTPILLLLLD